MERWIGVDFDGTLVTHEFPRIGKDIPLMISRVEKWRAAGIKVKILTARTSGFTHDVRKWLDARGWQDIEITASKDYCMIELWDDRSVSVELNTGKQLSPSSLEDADA